MFNIRTYRVDMMIYRVAQKSNPLPNDQKIVLNHIKTCQCD